MALPKAKLAILDTEILCEKFELTIRNITGNFCWNFGGVKESDQKVKKIFLPSKQDPLQVYI